MPLLINITKEINRILRKKMFMRDGHGKVYLPFGFFFVFTDFFFLIVLLGHFWY